MLDAISSSTGPLRVTEMVLQHANLITRPIDCWSASARLYVPLVSVRRLLLYVLLSGRLHVEPVVLASEPPCEPGATGSSMKLMSGSRAPALDEQPANACGKVC